MNQGLTPNITAIPKMQPDRYSSIVSSHSDEGIQPTRRLSPVGSLLAKSVLFACSQCDGPLVPSSYCIICKKTAARYCANCGSIRDMGIHDSCKNLVIIGSEINNAVRN